MKKFKPGEPLRTWPERTWNRLVAGEERDAARGPGSVPPPIAGGAELRGATVAVRNISGATVAAGGVLAITGPETSPDDEPGVVYGGPAVTGEEPDGTTKAGDVVVLLEPLEDGQAGAAIVRGITWAQVNVTDAALTSCGPVSATTANLSTAATGVPIVWKPSGTGVKWALVMLGGDGGGNIILAQVNEPGNVLASDTTFDFDAAIKIAGTPPTGGTGTAHKQSGKAAFSDNDWVVLVQREDNDEWWTTEQSSPGTGSTVVEFELAADLAIDDTEALARPPGSTSTLESDADTFYVVNFPAKWTGRTNYTESGGSKPAFRGTALLVTDDYNSTGKPGYVILDMEGWKEWIVVELYSGVTAGSAGCILKHGAEFDLPHANRKPPKESGSFDVTCYDDLEDSPAANAVTGELWLAKYEPFADHWVFVRPFEWCIVEGQCTAAVAKTDATFTIDSLAVVLGFMPQGETLTVQNEPITRKDQSGGGRAFSDNESVLVQWDKRDKKWRRFDHATLAVWHATAVSNVAGTSTFLVQNITKLYGNQPRESIVTVDNYLLGLHVAAGGKVLCLTVDDGSYLAVDCENRIWRWMVGQGSYNASAEKQYFGHESGTAKWLDVATYDGGCGIDVTDNEISFLAGEAAGNGLTGSGCVLHVGEGCGIIVTANAVSIDRSAIIGIGLEADDGECSIRVKYGCGLEIDDNDALAVDPVALAGSGLGVLATTGTCALVVNAGRGIEILGDAVAVKAGCGLQFDVDEKLEVNAADLAGEYLEVDGAESDDCKLKVKTVDVTLIESLDDFEVTFDGYELKFTITYTKRTGVKVLDAGTQVAGQILEGSYAANECV